VHLEPVQIKICRTDCSLIENTLTIPSMVTPTTRSPSPPSPLRTSCTPIFTVVCCPNLTILLPALQFQHTRALSAPAETRCFEERATARIPLRCPASCCSGANVTEENRWTRLQWGVGCYMRPRKVGHTLHHETQRRTPLERNQSLFCFFSKGYLPSSIKKSTQLTGFFTCKHFVILPVSTSQNLIVSS